MLLTTLFLASLFSVSFAKPIDEHILQKKTATPTPTASGDASVQTPVQRIFVDTDTCTDDQQKQINQVCKETFSLLQTKILSATNTLQNRHGKMRVSYL